MDNNNDCKEKTIVCPLFTIADCIAGCEEDCFCMESRCAWWVEDKQKCAVAAIGGERHGKR